MKVFTNFNKRKVFMGISKLSGSASKRRFLDYRKPTMTITVNYCRCLRWTNRRAHA